MSGPQRPAGIARRAVLAGTALLGVLAAPGAAGARVSLGWRQPVRVVQLDERLYLLDLGSGVWESRSEGGWELAVEPGDWVDIGTEGDQLLLLRADGRLFHWDRVRGLRAAGSAPPGAIRVAVSAGARWFAAPAAPGEPVPIWHQEVGAGVLSLPLEAPVSPFETAELERGYPVERLLFNQVILLGSPQGAVVVFRLRDLLATCSRDGCRPVPWRSPRTAASIAKPLRAKTPPPPMATVQSAVLSPDGGQLFVLPSVTDWDPETTRFEQRDRVLRLSATGEILQRCRLPRRAAALVRARASVLAVFDDGRWGRVCGE